MLGFLIIPILTRLDHAKAANNNSSSPSAFDHDDQPPSLAPSPFSSPGSIFKRLKCTDFMKEEMVMKVLEHLKAPKVIKRILAKSAKFSVCVANDFCRCLAFPYEPVILGCLAELGLKCMKEAILADVYVCTLGCANSMVNSTNLKLGNFFFFRFNFV